MLNMYVCEKIGLVASLLKAWRELDEDFNVLCILQVVSVCEDSGYNVLPYALVKKAK